nr:hypothetical protein [Desulfovibrio sp.]
MEKRRFPRLLQPFRSGHILPGIVIALALCSFQVQDACAWSVGPGAPGQGTPARPSYTTHTTVIPLRMKEAPVDVYESVDDMPEELRRIARIKGVEIRNGRPASQTADSRLGRPAGGFPVPMSRLANAAGIRKNMTQAQFREAYDAAVHLVAPFAGMPRERQLQEVMKALRRIFESPGFRYSTSAPHYNDPYGYFVLRVSSCAGCARTTILCLNILGIPCEHVNPNKWRHQWARVKVG